MAAHFQSLSRQRGQQRAVRSQAWLPLMISFWFQEEGCLGWVTPTEACTALKWSMGCVGELGKKRNRKPRRKFMAFMSSVEPHGSNYDLKKTLQA